MIFTELFFSENILNIHMKIVAQNIAISKEESNAPLEVGKKKKDSYRMPKKMYWHLYSLQTLNTEKFVSVVNKILRNEFFVIK